ncbi:MAG: hypothetical protein E7604_03165 [Ruminococcaceae bacterium]|nr:hypothetical protein [Oscillospiraceae bacterium]
MEYIYLFAASICFSVQFIFNKLFESRSDGSYNAGMWSSLATALCMLVYLLPAGGFTFAVSASAITCSLLYTVSSLLCSGVTILALHRGKIAVVTTYMLLGGLVLPFLWGIIAYGEALTVTKGIGVVILMLSMASSLLLDMKNDKNAAAPKKSGGLLFHFYCFILFMTNGIVSIATTQSQKAADAVSSDDFLLLCEIEIAAAAALILLIIGLWKKKQGDRHGIVSAFCGIARDGGAMTAKLFFILLGSCALYAVCNGLGNIFSLNCAQTMDASIQFPVISAVVIVLGAVFGWLIYHEKIERRDWIGLILAALGIVFFVI